MAPTDDAAYHIQDLADPAAGSVPVTIYIGGAPPADRTALWYDATVQIVKSWDGTQFSPQPPGGSSLVVTDNADGTLTFTASGAYTVVTNADSTLTITVNTVTANADGTLTFSG